MLELVIRNKRYRIRKEDCPSTFVEFVHFRSKGIRWIMDMSLKIHLPEEYNSWTIGWSDGEMEHLVEIDFPTGDMVQRYDRKSTQSLPTHFHPESVIYERGVR
jgi:hypothetical protein